MTERMIVGVDVFCGAGGLSYGLRKAGVQIVAGVDLDPACRFPFEHNNGAQFIHADVKDVEAETIAKLYPRGAFRLLAGCAPCQSFSPYIRSSKTAPREDWGMLRQFQRLALDLKPEFITMENVPGLQSTRVFKDFVDALRAAGYDVDHRSVYGPRLGLPQHRRRLVLVASLIGAVRAPRGNVKPEKYRTVRSTIGHLRTLVHGGVDRRDRLHKARMLSEINLKRMRASRPGGTWRDWPTELRAPCHQADTGSSYQGVYARMRWDEPSPTITTLAYNFGTGRFGHPEQDRAITLREAAMLQTFPRKYKFVAPREAVSFKAVGRLIGNAVPPRLAECIGRELVRTAKTHIETNGGTEHGDEWAIQTLDRSTRPGSARHQAVQQRGRRALRRRR